MSRWISSADIGEDVLTSPTVSPGPIPFGLTMSMPAIQAAREAARVGQHGIGLTVVVAQVRLLRACSRRVCGGCELLEEKVVHQALRTCILHRRAAAHRARPPAERGGGARGRDAGCGV